MFPKSFQFGSRRLQRMLMLTQFVQDAMPFNFCPIDATQNLERTKFGNRFEAYLY
jgi:hypothetical protein